MTTKVRERFWMVMVVDRPVEGEKFLTLAEIRKLVSADLESGVSVDSIRRALVKKEKGK